MFNYDQTSELRKGQIMNICIITYDPKLYANQRLLTEFKNLGQEVTLSAPEDLIRHPHAQDTPQLIRLGRYRFHENIQLLKNYSVLQLNSLESFQLARNKWKTYQQISHNIPMPVSQKTPLSFPCLIKLEESTKGEGVFLIENSKQIPSLSQDFFYQQWIEEAAGADFRLIMIEDQLIGAIQRTNTKDFRANSNFGSQAVPFIPPPSLVSMAQTVMAEMGLFYSALDFVKNQSGQYLLLEANASPGFQQFEQTTQINFAQILAKSFLKKVL